MSDELTPRKSPAASLWLWGGFLFSNLLGFGSVAVLYWIRVNFDISRLGDVGAFTAGALGLAHFFLIPFAMGFSATFFWKELPRRRLSVHSFANLGITLLGAFFVLREGVVCLVMAAPLLFWFQLMGTATTSYVVHASPGQIWPFIAGYPPIKERPEWWLWRLGLPAPIQSTAKPVVGSYRDCRFSGDVSIGERITEVVPQQKLTFVVTRQPRHPEVLNHFTIQQGRFLLTDNGDGTTTITGTSWYRLKITPVWYFDLWTRAIIRRVHLRVFEHIGFLARQKARTAGV